MDYKQTLAQFLASDKVSKDELLPLIVDSDGVRADIAMPCHKLAAKLKKSPVMVAEELRDCIKKAVPEWCADAQAVNGYLNVFLNREFYTRDVLTAILQRGDDFPAAPPNDKTVTIDYSSINIAKPFHIGHLLTTVIGGSLRRIFAFLGYNAVGINHLGDWGTQFGKLIVAVKKWGGGDTIEELSRLYVKFHEEAENDDTLNDEGRKWFKKIEEGDTGALALFRKFKEITLKEAEKVYKTLGVEFDSYAGESFYNDKMAPVVELLENKGLLTESDGAKVVDLKQYDMPPCLILKSDGASLYATRDLAAAIYRKNAYDFNQNLYVVAYQQNLHFRQVFKVLEMMGFDWAGGCKHVPFGMVSLEGGGSLSTRKGNVVLLKDVLAAAVEKAGRIIEEKNPDLEGRDAVAKSVGVGAVIFGAIFNSRIKDVSFSLDKALSFEGETGPYLQYTYARCRSVLSRGEVSGIGYKTEQGSIRGLASYQVSGGGDVCFDPKLADELTDDQTFEVIRLLGGFDGAVAEAAKTYEPSVISRYLMDLAQSFNRFYIDHRVINDDKKMQSARLLLTRCVANVLKNGLKLVLLDAPKKM
ncbi:MAG: arginine--tRNA ligase [Firmicutes bacterium]|nr:arginine--tRNA ligase [Bacillota bacterium]